MFALEPRFLFDGAAAATVDQQEPVPAPEVQETQQAETESVAAEQQVQTSTAEVSEASLMETVALALEASATDNELLFIDPAVRDYQQLAGMARPGVEVVILDPARDGIAQITETLAGRTDVGAIHIVSHGTPGRIFLATSDLTLETIESRAGELAAWSSSLSDGADILLYGCDVAAGESGRAFVDALAAVTGADVTASTNTTGNWAYGGDWNLEYAFGAIEASIVLTSEVQEQWFAVLATTTFQEGVNGYSGTQDTQIWGRMANQGTNYGSDPTVAVDSAEQGGELQGMIRFDNIFGVGASQIPVGAIIDSAQLILHGIDATTNTVSLHRMIVDWVESTATWNSMGGGLTSPADYNATVDSSVAAPGAVDVIFSGANLVATVQAWSSGTANNYGWAILNSGNDGWIFDSSEGGTAGFRPELIVNWHTNAAPTLDLDASGAGTGYATTFTENAGAVFIIDTTDATLGDVDSPNLSSLTVTIANLLDGAAESLSANTSGTSITASYNPGTGVLTLSGWDTVANYQQVLRTITYNNSSENPNTTARSINFVANDGSNNSNLATATVTVVAVNDAPVSTNDTLTIAEDTTTVLAVTDFGTYSDVESNPLAAVRISALATDGLLEYDTDGLGSWTAVTVNQVISTADINANRLRFVPDPNENGSPYATIGFEVSDGTDFSAATYTLTVDVTAVNDAPAGTDNTVVTNEDTTYNFTAADFGFTDVDSGDALSAVRIDTLPLAGTLTLFGSGPVAANDVILLADITAGNLRFTPAANANGLGYASFTFSVRDTGGPAFDAAPNTMTIDVTAVNDAPAVTADASTAYTQSAPAVVVDSSVPVTDVDDVNIESATITVSNVDRVNDLLTATGTAAITVTPYDSATGVLFLSGTATKAEYQSVLEGIQ
ncbi:MAG TPA: DUF4347 domain-containing protein, partial [Burkholderiales bacterium]|nr:DUF4347 domain-containing protein [Burkholderiales bacterium]